MAFGVPTEDPQLAAVLRARKINIALGGFAVWPWELANIPADWLEALEAAASIPERMKK